MMETPFFYCRKPGERQQPSGDLQITYAVMNEIGCEARFLVDS